jgi:small subunit ribosomal protein S9
MEKIGEKMSSSKKILVVGGKRKTAIARAVMKSGVGRIRINNIPLEIYEPIIVREKIREPLIEAGEKTWKKVDVSIKVKGGGFMGQAEAARMALANALVKWTKSAHLKSKFLKYDRTMIAGDPRRKEPKKFGGPGARARAQKSYR